MKGPLSPRVHGFIDYAGILLLFLAPTLFGFSGTPATILYVVAVLYLAMVLLTAYPLGVAKVIPFPVHGLIEAALSLLFIVAPFLLRFSDVAAARNFYIVGGIALGGVFLLTNYQAAEAPRSLAGERKRRYV
ncbi:hypothetical protein F0U61_00350 [Archangium violaceum]|uniref:SPW repeat domain-containing protein n=1 Tax=Archangium violaceum TaxID=83451 RepID=UPI002B2FB8AF|nr:hypothetical protein F0U61_00350 [Archangium violaceum]